MKRLFLTTLILVLTFSLAACGCQASDPMPETTMPTTNATTVPTTAAPTIETNIPDPSVDTSLPDMTEDTTETQTDSTGIVDEETITGENADNARTR